MGHKWKHHKYAYLNFISLEYLKMYALFWEILDCTRRILLLGEASNIKYQTCTLPAFCLTSKIIFCYGWAWLSLHNCCPVFCQTIHLIIKIWNIFYAWCNIFSLFHGYLNQNVGFRKKTMETKNEGGLTEPGKFCGCSIRLVNARQ